MLAVWSWLRELADFGREVDVDEGAATFDLLGLEVEHVTGLADDFAGVVIAEVVGRRPHPEAERLTLVDVITEAGGSATEVVCGAGNVPAPGGRVLWARPGARLPGGITIAPKKLKGVVSAGMLCSEVELGIGDDDDGIVVLGADERGAALGAEAQDALGLRDAVIEVSTAANRPDLLGHVGLARELVARLGGRLVAPAADVAAFAGTDDAAARVTVAIDDGLDCPRYTARVIDGVALGPSPRWLRWRLRAVGVRSISNLVDVTNYVMFETGQPLHAFDLAAVRGGAVRVRRASAGERLVTLDGVDRALEPDDIVIADRDGAIALAGVMGGRDSEVGPTTRAILLESAGFAPVRVRRTSQRLALRSEASQRFERGVDPAGADAVSARAATLIARLGGGRVARGVVDAYPRPPSPTAVRLRPARASAIAGVPLSAERAAELLGRLGVAVTPRGDELACVPPTHRIDLAREIDLVEDVIRLHGYDQVPATLPAATVAPRRTPDARLDRARRALTAQGFDESIQFGFTAPARIAALGFPPDDRRAAPLALVNPMSLDHSVMRTTLLANLLGAVARNQKRQVPAVRLFEVGRVFLATGADALPDEPTRLAAVVAGPRPGWLVPDGEVDFFDLRAAIEAVAGELLGPAAAEVRLAPDRELSWAHPGVAARVELGGVPIGAAGEVHPRTRAAFEIEDRCFAFELELDRFPLPAPLQMRPIPRFPAVSRDLSLLVDEAVSADRMGDLLGGGSDPWIERVELLEDYRDPARIPAGKRGVLWSITYRSHERTLTDAEVDTRHEALVGKAMAELGATRR